MDKIFSTTYSTLELVVYCIWVGISIASIMVFFEKRVMGGFVRALIKAKAVNPESSKHPDELKLRMNFLIKRSLQNRNSSLRHTVVCLGEEPVDGKYPEKKKIYNINKERFYIPEDKVYSAEERYSRKNTTVVLVIITIVVTFFLARAIVKYAPQITGLFENSLQNFASKK